MPLLDHFQPPLFPLRSWSSFHAVWAAELMRYLNQLLPQRYFADVQVHLGRHVEADVAEFDQVLVEELASTAVEDSPGGLAVQTWAPPAVTTTLEAVFPDDVEVRILDKREGGAALVAAIELISPGNKDRPETRRAFAVKCAAYLQRGVGLVIVDIVTERLFNLHVELLELLRQADGVNGTDDLYTTAYRPVRRQDRNQIDVWSVPLHVGTPLPVMPLPLKGAGCVPLDLESTYTSARVSSRL